MIFVVPRTAGRRTRFATSDVAIVMPARTPKFWIGTKLDSANVRNPKKSAAVV
jgi:hypothetical protein